jgi:hypothetical protein
MNNIRDKIMDLISIPYIEFLKKHGYPDECCEEILWHCRTQQDTDWVNKYREIWDQFEELANELEEMSPDNNPVFDNHVNFEKISEATESFDFEVWHWGNDAMPSIGRKEKDSESVLIIWVDSLDPSQSEFEESRTSGEQKIYTFVRQSDDVDEFIGSVLDYCKTTF